MSLSNRASRLLSILRRTYPRAECALKHKSALELLVSTILSAQCTDVRVNLVTPALFRRYPDARALAAARPADVRRLIHSTGFFRNKTRSIIGAARMIVGEFGGQVPGTMEELLRLPGVARKTANVVLGTWFGKSEGVVVDTHVGRLSRRMGLTRHQDPVKVEKDLMAVIAPKSWTEFSHLMIHHGRQICDARKPLCPKCPVAHECPAANSF